MSDAPEPLRTVVVDDEAAARGVLRDMLAGVPDLDVVGEAEGGAESIALIEAAEPDLVFLDVQMPEVSGFDVLARVEGDFAVVFTTAFDQYAVAAFELGALDYLLKPFSRERLAVALGRARASLQGRRPALAERVRTALASQDAARPLDRLFVRDRSGIVPVRIADVVRLEGQGDYVAVCTLAGQRHLVYLPLYEFERRLDPAAFVRVHRSHIVNLDHVRALVPYDATRLSVAMADGAQIVASRAYSKVLRQLVV